MKLKQVETVPVKIHVKQRDMELLTMDLHDIIYRNHADGELHITKVFGGWIYTIITKMYNHGTPVSVCQSSTFVRNYFPEKIYSEAEKNKEDK